MTDFFNFENDEKETIADEVFYDEEKEISEDDFDEDFDEELLGDLEASEEDFEEDGENEFRKLIGNTFKGSSMEDGFEED